MGRSIDFYVQKLGFESGFGGRDGPGALLRFIDGDTRWMLGLFQVDSLVRRHAADCHISFRIAEQDIDGVIPYLRERGRLGWAQARVARTTESPTTEVW